MRIMKAFSVTLLVVSGLFFGCNSSRKKQSQTVKEAKAVVPAMYAHVLSDYDADTFVVNSNKVLLIQKFTKGADHYVNNLLCLKVALNGDTLGPATHPSSSFCGGAAMKFLPCFKGSDVDNLRGDHPVSISFQGGEYLVFFASFNGCNGRYCNNTMLLAIRRMAADNKASRVYALGIDGGRADIGSATFTIANNCLQMKLHPIDVSDTGSMKDEHTNVLVTFGNSIQFSSGKKREPLNEMFFCIKE